MAVWCWKGKLNRKLAKSGLTGSEVNFLELNEVGFGLPFSLQHGFVFECQSLLTKVARALKRGHPFFFLQYVHFSPQLSSRDKKFVGSIQWTTRKPFLSSYQHSISGNGSVA